MNDLVFNQDEFPTNEEQIRKAEEVWGTEFPEEYKAFLLRQNGGEVYPSTPSVETKINRFISFERHRTLNWLRRFMDMDEWDETDTST